MILAQQNEVLLKVYSIDYLLKCKVEEATERILQLSPISGKVDMFQIYDPTVVIFSNEKQLKILPADVAAIDKAAGQVTFTRPEKDVDEDRRIFERYPVSLSVSARRKFSSRRLHFVAKNISMYGMGVISQTELDVEECIDIDLITDRNMFYIGGKVIWKETLGRGFEFGLQLTHFDITTKQSFEAYLVKQKDEYMKMINKAR